MKIQSIVTVSCVLAGIALGFAALAPVNAASANQEAPVTILVPEQTILGEIPTQTVREPASVSVVHRTVKVVKSAPQSTRMHTFINCTTLPLTQGTTNTTVQVCDAI